MNILAIDCGVERVGYSVFDKSGGKNNLITSGLIKTSKSLPMEKRLLVVYEFLQDIIKTHQPTAMVIEQLFFSRNQKTVISVAQSQGALQLLAAQNNIPLEYLTPLQIKLIITGYGAADKEAVKKMVGLTLKDLDLTGKIDDEIDAIACGLAYCYINKALV
jgi:crossover junction endodeoxyribonuclease RuvC